MPSRWSPEELAEVKSLLDACGSREELHARVLKGENDHHRAEAMCKALGRALAAATRIEPRLQGGVPSTKGSIG